MDNANDPKPIASIQEEREVYILDDGGKRERKDIFAKLYVTFRDKWLKRLNCIELKVFFCLLLHTNADGECWPTLQKISDLTGFKSLPDISQAISSLAGYGLVIRKRQGIGKPTRYTVLSHREN